MFVEDLFVDVFLRGLILSALAMLWIAMLVRLNGLRSFSKMTPIDFVMTVGEGSLLGAASLASSWEAYAQALIAMAALLLMQYITARARRASDTLESLMQNTPVLLMRDGRILDRALDDTRVSRDDLIAKLRNANVLDLSRVRAVILETTGDISVLHGETCSEALLQGTRRVDS